MHPGRYVSFDVDHFTALYFLYFIVLHSFHVFYKLCFIVSMCVRKMWNKLLTNSLTHSLTEQMEYLEQTM